ncbi:MAG: ABC transporter ATP-binding protein [Fimbriimonadaceae bacterium]|nr:ABC transporter ATP-binding protein [Alphaproteobacteria bacterium]
MNGIQEIKREDMSQKPDWGRRGTAGATIAARLSFQDVTHRYGATLAVDRFSLDIEPGEIMCLLGKSGCGKTTLLRIAAGIEKPVSGRVLMNDLELSGPNVFVPPEKRGIGLMFQDYALFPHRTIIENVMFGLTTLNRRDAKNIALSALKRVGLERSADEYPHELSRGEQQRVALARAIVPRPSVLLMDEPFSGLDQRLRDNVREETIAILRETRMTCLMVTHDPQEAMHIADRIVLMREGRVEQVGAPREIYSKPASLFAGRFFCAFNELPGVVKGGFVETALGKFAAPDFKNNDKVTVCVRPQGVRLQDIAKGVPGRIQRIDFLGEVDEVVISVEAMDAPIHVRRPAGYRVPVGTDVGVIVIPEQVLIFRTDKK